MVADSQSDLLAELLNGRPESSGKYTQTVTPSEDFKRIYHLPRRVWEENPRLPRLIEAWSRKLRTPHASAKTMLRPAQAQYFTDLALGLANNTRRGALIPADVGTGKTLMGLLTGTVADTWRNMYIVPGMGGGVSKMRDEARVYARDWKIRTQTFLSYEAIEQERKGKNDPSIVQRYMPEVLYFDEAGRLSNPQNVCWRVLSEYIHWAKYRKDGPRFRPIIVFADATFSDGALKEFWHLARVALGSEYAPVPDNHHEMLLWSGVLDVEPREHCAVGALKFLSPLTDKEKCRDDQAQARIAFRKRWTQTPGIIASGLGDRPTAKLKVRALNTKLPPNIEHALRVLRTKKVTPGGERVKYAFDLWRWAGELACGYYKVIDPAPPAWWSEPRTEWNDCVAKALDRRMRGVNKPLDVTRAVRDGYLPEYERALAEWEEVKEEFTATTRAVWITDEPLHAAAEWLTAHPKHGLVWTSHYDAGLRLSELSGVPFFAAKGRPTDPKFGKRRIDKATRSGIVSLNAIWKGFNLQHQYWRNLYIDVPTKAKKWQQSLGRTHRAGQEHTVTADVWLACPEHEDALVYALRRARYSQDHFGSAQKLLYADNELPRHLMKAANTQLEEDWYDGEEESEA
jgi:hypothetical protein